MMSETLMKQDNLPNDTNNNEGQMPPSNNSGMDGQVCRDYQRGVCNRGGKCKFSHPEGQGKEVESSPMICRDFQNGKCSRSTCKYMHISIVEEKMYLRTGQMPARRPGPMGGGGPPMRSGYGGGYQTRANRSDPVCKDFLNNKCSRGSSCKYRHSYEEEGGYGGYDNFSRKRRRESFGDGDFSQENESLRRQVADLQKQVADLKATNEVLLEQNARYRNAATGSTAYPNTASYQTSYPSKPSTTTASSYSTTYPTPYSTNGATSYTSFTTGSTVDQTTPNATAFNSAYPAGTGYIKFE